MMFKIVFNIYQEKLFSISYTDRNVIQSKYNISYELINYNNYRIVEKLRSKQYVNDFKQMLKLGDIGVYAKINNKIVGYGWVKKKDSKDYFFKIDEFYLCRFYVHNDFRGFNIYSNIINWLMTYINDNYCSSKFYIAVEAENNSSTRGVEKIGFNYIKTLNFYRLLKITLNNVY